MHTRSVAERAEPDLDEDAPGPAHARRARVVAATSRHRVDRQGREPAHGGGAHGLVSAVAGGHTLPEALDAGAHPGEGGAPCLPALDSPVTPSTIGPASLGSAAAAAPALRGQASHPASSTAPLGASLDQSPPDPMMKAPPEQAPRRLAASGLSAVASSGRARSLIQGPQEALGLVSDELLAAEQALHALVGAEVPVLTEAARYLALSGGKRLRPALTALGARAVGWDGPGLPRLMASGELIHLGSLLHDDVVDDAETRRGRPAARVVFGNAVAVLAGDLCVGRALATTAEVAGHEATVALARTVAEMSEGEVLQLQRAGCLDADEAGYLDVVDRKSASLIAWCVSAPALAVGDTAAAAALGAYGRAVGRAFQITDDVLDYRPSTGKAPGADLRERKVTLPLLRAFDRIPGLRARLEEAPPTQGELPSLVAEIAGSGALEAALAQARRGVAEAVVALDVLPPSDGRRALEVLAAFLVERSQ